MPTSSYPSGASAIPEPAVPRRGSLRDPQQRVRGADLIVPVGPNQQQMLHLRMCGQVLDEVERRCVQPLQIIKEQRERMFLAREHAEETSENHLEAVLRILWRQIGDRRLFPDHQFQFGDEIDDQAAIRAQGFPQRFSPLVQLDLAFAQNMADQGLERLREGGVRNVALVLIELAGREQASRRNEHLVKLIDHRRLADAGIAGDQHEFRRAIRHYAIEGCEQRVNRRAPFRIAAPGAADGPRYLACPAGTARYDRAPPIALGSAAGPLPGPPRSDNDPPRIWLATSSR